MRIIVYAATALAIAAGAAVAQQAVAPIPDAIKPTGLNAFGLNVAEIEKQRVFYETAFGLKVATRVPAQGEVREYLMSFTGRREDRPLLVLTKAASPRQPGQDAFGRIIFGAPNAAELARRVVAAGGRTRNGAAIREGGTNMVVDPEGNLIELYQAAAPAAK